MTLLLKHLATDTRKVVLLFWMHAMGQLLSPNSAILNLSRVQTHTVSQLFEVRPYAVTKLPTWLIVAVSMSPISTVLTLPVSAVQISKNILTKSMPLIPSVSVALLVP